MKIVHVCLNGVYTEGWSYQENLLSKYHARLGNEVTLIANKLMYDDSGAKVVTDETDYFNDNNVKVIRLSEKNDRPLSKFQRYPELYKILELEEPDVLFVHSCQFLDAKLIVKYTRYHPQSMVYVDNHADFSNSATGWFSKNILHKIVWRRCAQKLLPITETFYGVMPSRVEFLEKMYGLPSKKVKLLVMGADDEKVEVALHPKIKEQIRKQYGFRKDDFLIITGGKIDFAKKQTLLLMQAVNNLNMPNVKLLVFGSIVDEIKDEVLRLCSPAVHYIGWVNSQKTDHYFAAADLVVFPGRHSVFWEQVAGLGIPMVCKYWEGTDHIDVGGNVIFLYNDSVAEIERTLYRIVTDEKLYDEMKQVAKRKGMRYFSYKEIARRSIQHTDFQIVSDNDVGIF